MQFETLTHIDQNLNAKHFGKHWALCGSLALDSAQLTEDKEKVTCPYCLGLLDKK
jgi:hypothetical protein